MIYLLHDDPAENAKMLDDATLNRQIKAIRDVLIGVVLYIRGDVNYSSPEGIKQSKCPYRIWARECRANYLKLVEMGMACCEEYEYRFNEIKIKGLEYYVISDLKRDRRVKYKLHKLQPVIEFARNNVPYLPTIPENCHIESRRELEKNNIVPGATPSPLTVPKKYHVYQRRHECNKCTDTTLCNTHYRHVDNPFEFDIIESYRNYYVARLHKMKLKYELWLDDIRTIGFPEGTKITCWDEHVNTLWTRREKPELL